MSFLKLTNNDKAIGKRNEYSFSYKSNFIGKKRTYVESAKCHNSSRHFPITTAS